MTDDLKQRLRDYINTTDDCALRVEAADLIEQLEAERDKLRDQVEMLRDALLTCSVGDFSTGHVIPPSFDEKLVEEALAATDPTSTPTDI